MNIVIYINVFPDMLVNLYNSWGFKKEDITNLPKENTALNPDGFDTWTFEYNNKKICSCSFKKDNINFRAVA